MKKIFLLSILTLTSIIFAGCTKTATTIETNTTQSEPTASPESMMEAPMQTAAPKETPVDISVDAQLKSTKPVGTSDDTKTLNTDLNNTTIMSESFN